MTYLFTHDDLDGVGCAIIAYLAFPKDLAVTYCSYKTVNQDINTFLDTAPSDAQIIISDISVDEATASRLDHCNVQLYDHHPIKVLRPWMTVDTSVTQCGTSLLAAALLPEMAPAVRDFVDAVCLYDTWQFEKASTHSQNASMRCTPSWAIEVSSRWSCRLFPSAIPSPSLTILSWQSAIPSPRGIGILTAKKRLWSLRNSQDIRPVWSSLIGI